MTRRAEQVNGSPVLIVLVYGGLHQVLHELHEGGLLLHEEWILWEFLLIFRPIFFNYVGWIILRS